MAECAKIFKAYDIRGTVPDELDESVAEAVGAAFVRLTGASAVVTVHDMRTSSPDEATLTDIRDQVLGIVREDAG